MYRPPRSSKASATSMEKVKGRRRATPMGPFRPGSMPMITPSRLPMNVAISV
jgi:hypothetical protein